jgi:GT2 family glycosyltransferase
MELSIVIVSYKCKDKLRVTLDAVYASEVNFTYEVLLIDNDSQDGTVEMVEQEYLAKPDIAAKIVWVKNSANVGFGKGNNQGLEKAKGKYVLLLNSDTKVAPDTLQVMMDFMKSRPDVGIATCKLMKANGDLDWACRRSFPDPWVSFFRLSGLSKLFPKNKTLAAYNLTYKSIDEETEIDSCVGAFMFISPACLEAVKGFDADYYMYGEDLDMCYRAKQAGFKVWYYPKTTTIHYKGQSSKRAPKQMLYAFHDAMWIFYRKHLKSKYPAPFNWLVYIGIWGRYYVKLIQNMLRKEAYVSK